MSVVKKTFYRTFQQGLPVLVFAIITIYTYAFFFLVPYIDFVYDENGTIVNLRSLAQNNPFQLGDEIEQVGSVRFNDYIESRTIQLFIGVTVGDIVPIEIERGGQLLTILYAYPGITSTRFLDRLNNPWWIPFVFWLIGTTTYLFIRPRNTQWRLLVAFSFLTAIWISTGGGASNWHIWGASYIFIGTLWLSFPVYLHLHWNFPKPFGKFPASIIYPLALGLLILNWLRILPKNTFLAGFLFSIAGSLGLLIAHTIFQPEQRGPLRQLVKLISIILLPIIITTINTLFSGGDTHVIVALVGLPFLPAAYVYAIYKHQLGKLEVRANRLLVLYLYMTLLITAVSILVTYLTNRVEFPGSTIIISLFVVVLTGLATILWFDRFERFVERRILGMPVPPTSLVQSYAAAIATKLDKQGLAAQLANQVVPSLLVRQSALVYYSNILQPGLPHSSDDLSVLFDLDAEVLPSIDDFPLLLDQANMYRLTAEQGGNPTPCPWVRLVLPLYLGERVIGLWLLGQRDPDNFYSQAELPVLNALAAQTAVALTNILQAQNLHALYQFSIDQQEQERNKLALDLHDDVLNQIGLLGMYVDEDGVAPQFFEVYDTLTERFRETIHGLRPVMLNYGLQTAFTELTDTMCKRPLGSAIIQNELPACHMRYPVRVERHLYRIVQQATENALQHADAKTIRIYGKLQPNNIHIIVEDDGIGISSDETIDLSYLLQRKHFGLAGMFERADLIGAKMRVLSVDQQGTQIFLNWVPPN